MDITIKEAGKGSTVVIMDTNYYEGQTLSMLEGNNKCEKSTHYKVKNNGKPHNCLKEYNKRLTSKEIGYTFHFYCKTSNFNGLPKIHKCQRISYACKFSTKA